MQTLIRKSLPPGAERLAISEHPNSPYTEALRALRTALLLAKSSTPPQLLLVTSSVAGEGKSVLSANLAAVLAQGGKRVLLVDADMRKPTLADRMGLRRATGLSQFLTDDHLLEDIVELPSLPRMHMLTSGPIPPYPAELLGSARMEEAMARWRESYDFIVLDSPPVLLVTDPVVLASLADATLLVARYGLTNRLSLCAGASDRPRTIDPGPHWDCAQRSLARVVFPLRILRIFGRHPISGIEEGASCRQLRVKPSLRPEELNAEDERYAGGLVGAPPGDGDIADGAGCQRSVASGQCRDPDAGAP